MTKNTTAPEARWDFSAYLRTHLKHGYRVPRSRTMTPRQRQTYRKALKRLGDNPTEARIQSVIRWIERSVR